MLTYVSPDELRAQLSKQIPVPGAHPRIESAAEAARKGPRTRGSPRKFDVDPSLPLPLAYRLYSKAHGDQIQKAIHEAVLVLT